MRDEGKKDRSLPSVGRYKFVLRVGMIICIMSEVWDMCLLRYMWENCGAEGMVEQICTEAMEGK